ncbi:hypothetical protein OEZ85_005103 [Tetradesmus obliquus]|uniref:Uncharacterized protein n=1 Tax=Tetradesmus obliquus TaxID=3088 RepID=A0ABY8UMA6_TETOB|nr:hypothetical protein OEZ85_005103 [Tetradesmus obliquus]
MLSHSSRPDGLGRMEQQLALGPGEEYATAQQSAAAELGQLKVLDVQEVADRFKADLQPSRLSYVHHLAAQAPLSKLAQPDQGSRLPPNVQPSVLQQKLSAGANRLSSCLLPTPTADGLAFNDLPLSSLQHQQQPGQQQRSATPAGSSSSSNKVWQFGFSLLRATHVGPTGFKSQRQPLYRVARVCIFDKANHRFLGNVHALPVSEARAGKGGTWSWDAAGSSSMLTSATRKPRADLIPAGELAGSAASVAAAASDRGGLLGAVVEPGTEALAGGLAGAGGANSFVVRCAQDAPGPVCGLQPLAGERLSLYIELNVAFKLTVEDAGVVPVAEAKGAGLVSEFTTCWALVSLTRCAELSRQMDISVPLYTGSIYQPGLLAAMWAADRKRHPVRSMFSAAPAPQLTFSAGPLPAQPPPLLGYSLMPSTLIARRDMAYLLAAARLALTQQLAAAAAEQQSAGMLAGPLSGCSAGVAAGFGDAALAALPGLLDDGLLQEELLARWWGRCRGLAAASEGDCLLSCKDCSTATGPPTQQQLVAALRTSVLEVAPLLRCSNLPPPHMSNFLEQQSHRAHVAAAFLRVPQPGSSCTSAAAAAPSGSAGSAGSRQQPGGVVSQATASQGPGRHPVEVLSSAGAEFLHAPFDVSETRVCLAEQHAARAARWSRC